MSLACLSAKTSQSEKRASGSERQAQVKTDSQRVDQLLDQADRALQQGDVETALALTNEAAALDPNNRRALNLLADIQEVESTAIASAEPRVVREEPIEVAQAPAPATRRTVYPPASSTTASSGTSSVDAQAVVVVMEEDAEADVIVVAQAEPTPAPRMPSRPVLNSERVSSTAEATATGGQSVATPARTPAATPVPTPRPTMAAPSPMETAAPAPAPIPAPVEPSRPMIAQGKVTDSAVAVPGPNANFPTQTVSRPAPEPRYTPRPVVQSERVMQTTTRQDVPMGAPSAGMDCTRDIREFLRTARAEARNGNYDAAMRTLADASACYPAEEARIERVREDIAAERDTMASASDQRSDREARKRAEALFEEGEAIYDANPGDLAALRRARQLWLDALEIDPAYELPAVYLANTEADFNTLESQDRREENFRDREAVALQKLETPVSIATEVPTPLSQILFNLKLITDINFVLSGISGDANVVVNFTDKPLREILDSMLLPIGLKWERKPGEDTIVITPNLRTKVFKVSPDELAKIDALIEKGTLQALLYGPDGQKALDSQELYTDLRQNVVVITDSQQNIEKLGQLIGELESQADVGLVFKSYLIQEDKAPRIKAILEALLRVDDRAPFNPDRKLIIEGGELIVKDTPDNIARVEKILQDRQFLRQIYSNELDVRTFNLTPVLEIQDNREQARQFAENIVQVVETLLYAQEGRRQANAQGRRLFYDEATLQLTVVDFPDRLKQVQDFIESLPQIEQRRRQKIIFLNWASAADLAGQIQTFLGTAPLQAGGGDTGGDSITKTLRVEGELEFRGAFFRVVRVNENDAIDENDDDVELVVRTGTTTQDTTIEEFRSEFVEDYEIVADDVDPSSTPGEGRAKLTIRYVPGGQGGGGAVAPVAAPVAGLSPAVGAVPGAGVAGVAGVDPLTGLPLGLAAAIVEEAGATVEPIENLNAIFIEYENASDLQEVEFYIETLDVPTLQVTMEIKFVEVVESKAKQLQSEFRIGNLLELSDVSLGDGSLGGRFAQDTDEFTNPFEPFIESTQSANLLKGATVFNYILNNGQSPIALTLRALESQGIINVVNAPSITVLNGESATFEITREFGLARPPEGATGGGDQDNFIIPPSLEAVVLEVTPSVTQAGNITLDPISAEIRDFDQSLGAQQALSGFLGDTGIVSSRDNYLATTNSVGGLGVLVKEIDTIARIRDGGTVVLGGWRNERKSDSETGVPILSDIPFIGKFLFSRQQETLDKITLMIFLTGSVVRD
ncbi:MAG: hypothetical protein RLY93_10905 [Sumerlaeia bacterium]